ncbi:MAG: DUF4388 domain-containing protein [Microthrixaceae bacterium]
MALQGSIDSFSVVDVLRMLGASGKSGRLVVVGVGGSGSLWLVDGAVVAGVSCRAGARPVEAPPADVLFDLLRLSEGSFVFETGSIPDAGMRRCSQASEVSSLIEAAEASMLEWQAVLDVVGSPSSTLSLAPVLTVPELTVGPARWAVLVGIAALPGVATPARVGADLGVTELVAMREIAALVDAGAVVTGMPPAEIPGDGDRRLVVDSSFDTDPYVAPPADAVASAIPIAAPISHALPRRETAPLPEMEFRPPEAVVADESSVGAPPPYSPAPSPDGEPSAARESDFDDADLARQMALLSPQAAQAVADADREADPAAEPIGRDEASTAAEERARVTRFLGSV